MGTTRQDSWSKDEDVLLAEVVLRHIREGSTQLAAFDEVGKKLSRTAAACGFRWNSYVRKQYASAIELAKKQRKEQNKSPADVSNTLLQDNTHDNIGAKFKEVIALLQEMNDAYENSSRLLLENNQLKEQLKQLEQQNKILEEQLSNLKLQYEKMESDYQSMLDIMDRARKMATHKQSEDNQKSESGELKEEK